MATEHRPPDRRLGVTGVGNAAYIEEMYARWQQDPTAVSGEWQAFFSGFDLAMCPRDCVAAARARAQSQVASLIFAYRALGHLIAQVDPLGNNPTSHPTLALERYGLDDTQLDQVFDTGHLHGPARAPLREVIAILRDTYCRSIGVEYIHIQDRDVRRWLQAQMEPVRNKPSFAREQQREILHHLIDAEVFETFVHSRYPAQKRFSLEGAESLIPALHHIVELAPQLGAEELVMGMAHRGRLNVLANILDKPYAVLFNEFEDNLLPEWVGGDGDVKYHRGFSSDHASHTAAGGKVLHISLTANPSHLEAVDPVVEGRARAKQRRRDDSDDRSRVIPLLIHGDAAFAGQGLVAETLNLSQLPGYKTGGTVHFIVNNQIGFTTLPAEARSSLYSTDVAKMVEAPILHVNGDDPEAVVWAVDLALRFRQQFHRDVVVDMICYRRHGHNEGDEPAFTQPQLYAKIKDRPSVRVLYTDQLMRCCDLSEEDGNAFADEFKSRLQAAFEAVKYSGSVPVDVHTPKLSYDGVWEGLDHPFSHAPADTAVDQEVLVKVARALATVPEGFQLNPKVARQLPKRTEAVEGGGEVDWSLAELLALGSLLVEGKGVRLSGQDSARGTFSQRHSVWHDMTSQRSYTPLNNIEEGQEKLCVYNSMLSEAAVLGFDYGYSLAEPHMLVMWEAQFGDFANGAQVIIDQFVVGSFAKWQRSSGLVMLLPHGYEGQGPEHSNAYLERYLAACAEDNIQVCNLTTPAQYFHALRRQLRRPFRRPLIIMSPKSLLRHPRVVSPVAELATGTFHEILDDPVPPAKARRLVLCSGKVFYDLLAAREESGVDDVAIVRLEQLYPLHEELLHRVTKPYLTAEEIMWVQEEPANRGGWSFMLPRLLELFPKHRLRYAGRPASASPATGSMRVHRQEQEALVHEALMGAPELVPSRR